MAHVWNVSIVLPDTGLSELFKRTASLWLTTGPDSIPLPRDLVQQALDVLQHHGWGGVPVSGSLTITPESITLETKPTFTHRLAFTGNLLARIVIPLADITAIRGPKSLALGVLTGTLGLRRVAIETASATFFISADLNGPALTRSLKAAVAQAQ